MKTEYFEPGSVPGCQKKGKKFPPLLAHYLPYGRWFTEDGRTVYYSRSYTPVLCVHADGSISRPDPGEWVEGITRQEFFYDDTCPPRHSPVIRERLLAVLAAILKPEESI